MKNYTNEELCYLISQPCNNTAKAEYFKRIKFRDEYLEHKLVLHVPTKKLAENELVDVDYKKFIEAIIKGLAVAGCTFTQVTGYYKRRVYPEMLVTIFLNNEQLSRVDYWFRHAMVKCHLEMQQEAYAYELDGKMHILSL